jgi:hypothetical protein
MGFLGRTMTGLQAGITAFREAYLHADDPAAGGMLAGSDSFNQWERYEARRLRYAMGSAFWQNDAYRLIHTWSKQHKTDFGMYRHSRHIYNPAHRTIEFHVCHIYNGALDADAGDGSEVPSACPIILPDDAKQRDGKAIRGGIATLWRDGHWQTQKSIWVRNGAMMGDAPLAILDVPPDGFRPGQLQLKPLHPATIKWYQADTSGAVVSYIREERRLDPREIAKARNIRWGVDPLDKVRAATFTEEAELIPGVGVLYRTFLDYAPWDWNSPDGKGITEWVAPYPAVPLVMARHIQFGSAYGMSEIHTDLSKIREADDAASKLGDQIRQLTNPVWLFSGFKKADVDLALAQIEATATNPEASRQQLPTLYAHDVQAKAQALVADAKIDHISAHIATIIGDIELDHPELRYDRLVVSGALSGTALQLIRKPAETKVNERRAEYDGPLAKLQELALVIGGIRGYPGYAPASMSDYGSGRFRHSIGKRSVFGVDATDRIAEDTAEAGSIKAWTDAGLPLEVALRQAGWSAVDIEEVKTLKDAASAKALAAAQAAAPLTGPPDPAKAPINTNPLKQVNTDG